MKARGLESVRFAIFQHLCNEENLAAFKARACKLVLLGPIRNLGENARMLRLPRDVSALFGAS